MTTGQMSRIIKQLGYERIIKATNCGRVIVPGLAYTNFHGNASPHPWSVMDIIDSTQICLIHPTDGGESFLGLHQLFGETDAFAVTAKIDLSEQLHDEAVVKAPLCTDTTVSNVGKSTIVMDTVMKSGSVPLVKYRCNSIILDRTSKKPVEIPQQWKSTYGHFCTGEPLRFSALERPSDQSRVSNVFAGQVSYSDIDANRHVHFTNYLKYCCEGLVKVQTTQSGLGLQPLKLKSAFMWYRKECNFGDAIELDFWEHETKPGAICVDMLKNGGKRFSVCT
ncbi:uncharacterized protein LOC124287171 [Haliotis rubra]|uniref:uncharacterized protein LOC124287171 n=1 Tax=Haliotis rubra TaxID=36100 RepID=UPI001EE5631C|nr:uncharacterized protein LOC124287171 [Haliotis rubra]